MGLCWPHVLVELIVDLPKVLPCYNAFTYLLVLYDILLRGSSTTLRYRLLYIYIITDLFFYTGMEPVEICKIQQKVVVYITYTLRDCPNKNETPEIDSKSKLN